MDNMKQPLVKQEEYVYRIMPLRFFLSMIKRKKIYLPRVSKWDDPYELFLFKQKYKDKSGNNVDMTKEAERIFGQCWTSQRDSDALWRIYSPDKMSVRIKTTKQKIENIVKANIGNGLMICSDYVTYKSQRDINNYIKGMTTSSVFSNDTLIKSLFIKRNSFEHEKEYRIIARMADFTEHNDYINNCPNFIEIPISFEPNDFIEEVYLDPRLSDEEVAIFKPSITIRMGNTCPVSQSTLYKIKIQELQYQ